MFDNFTDSTKELIFSAQNIAMQNHNTLIEPIHILYSMANSSIENVNFLFQELKLNSNLFIADAKNVSALVISTEGNCPDSEWLDTKLREFVKIYRAKNPTCEIVIMPFLVSGRDTVIPNVYERRMRDRDIQKKIVSDFKNAGDEHIHLFIQDDFLPKDVWHEVTIDGLHLNELGFYYVSKGLYEFLTQLGL